MITHATVTLQGNHAIKAGIKLLEQRNHEGKTAFLMACEQNNVEIAEWILETYGKSKINVFARDYNGNTAMHVAVLNENQGLVQTLFDIDNESCLAKNHDGKSPFHLAVEKENILII